MSRSVERGWLEEFDNQRLPLTPALSLKGRGRKAEAEKQKQKSRSRKAEAEKQKQKSRQWPTNLSARQQL
jgi:hypothetical protein